MLPDYTTGPPLGEADEGKKGRHDAGQGGELGGGDLGRNHNFPLSFLVNFGLFQGNRFWNFCRATSIKCLFPWRVAS